mmetsp:Transcript_30550/g.70881  ORF Transcript_30550/g.70881 Transcript_30550/m.70881 type:complete len:351 (-) Transcript_30550:157-1209(-)
MRSVMAFIHRRGVERRLYRQQAKECVKILLNNPGWHHAAYTDEGLRRCLADFLADSPDAAGRLQEAPVEPAKVQARRQKQVLSACDPSEGSEVRDMLRTQVLQSWDVMESFGFRFPGEPTSTGLDEATEGYRMLYDAVNRLCAACKGQPSDGGVLSGLLIQWDQVLDFLVSMHSSGLRNTHRSRIKFVVAKLEAFVPAFRAAVASRGGLPWPPEASGAAARGDAASVPMHVGRAAGARVRPADDGPKASGCGSRRGCSGQRAAVRYSVCNGTPDELTFYIEQTGEVYRLRGGDEVAFRAESMSVRVRISRPGLFGWAILRKRLADAELLPMKRYNVTRRPTGGVTCVHAS